MGKKFRGLEDPDGNLYEVETDETLTVSGIPADAAAVGKGLKECLAKNQGSENVGKILVVGTDGNLVLTDMPEGGATGDVVGVLDESNNILLSGNLADGTYTLVFVDAEGNTTGAGTLEVKEIVTYTITQNLTNATSDNSMTSIRSGESISINLTANEGYEISSIEATMGGTDITSTVVNGANINISNVTGSIVITAIAEEIVVTEPTNFAEPNTTNITDWSIWCNDARFGSDGAYRQSAGNVVTNYIPFKVGDILYFEGLNVAITGTSMNQGLVAYDANKANIAPSYLSWWKDVGYANINVTDGAYTIELLENFNSYQFSGRPAGSETAFVRISGALTGSVDDVVIRVKRNGVWL